MSIVFAYTFLKFDIHVVIYVHAIIIVSFVRKKIVKIQLTNVQNLLFGSYRLLDYFQEILYTHIHVKDYKCI